MTDLLRTLASLFTRDLPGKREQLAQVGSTANGETARTRIAALAIGSKRMELGKVWADIAMISVSHRRTTESELADLTSEVIDDIAGSLDYETLYALAGRQWILRNVIYDELHRHSTGARDTTSISDKAKMARMRAGAFARLQKATLNIIEARIDEAASNMDTRN